MAYKKYEIPLSDGITWASGPFPLQSLPANYRCTLDQAQRVQNVVGGTLVDASKDSSLGMTFHGLEDNDPWRPFYAKCDFPGFVGPAVEQMNAKGIGYPCHWEGVPGNRKLVFDGPPVVTPVPVPIVANPGDVLAFGDPSGNIANAQTDSARIKHIEEILMKAFPGLS